MTTRMNMTLIAAAILVAAAPMLLGIQGEYGGADGQAKAAIEESGYQPWFESIWTPPSGEIESLLFALQAAIGAGGLGYVLGRRHGARRK
jgi:cobalt/nickel transport protein